VSQRPRRVQRVEIEWFDIEGDAGWGEGAKELPVVTQIGYVHSRPSKKQKIPFWKIKTSQVEDEPGGTTIIPAVNVVSVEYLGWKTVPWRKR
jgi:hypothetical protein